MKRVIYFGTDGCVGHYPKGINCTLSKEEYEGFVKLDKLFDDEMYVKTSGLFFYNISNKRYICFGLPYSADDKRGGSKTIVAVEDGEKEDLLVAIKSYPFLLKQFSSLGDEYKDILNKI